VKKEKVEALPSTSLTINVEKTTAPAVDEPPIIVQLPDLTTAPSLRGRIFVEGNMHKCQGVWAMNDSSHTIPGQTSDFELRLSFPGDAPADVPVDGRYTGWFMIKNPQKGTTSKIEDKDLDLKFTKKDDSSDFEVSGAGVNKYGRFLIQGTLKSNNMIQLYKIYQPKRAPGATPRGSVGGSPRPRGTSSLLRQSSSVAASPRETSSRVRRPSLALAESLAPPEKVVATSKPSVQRSSSKQLHRQSTGDAAVSRVSRPPPFVSKCKDVVKDIAKQPSAIYFTDAVDYVKLGIPDYPTIIKEPMDFGTIRVNLDKNFYKAHENFADHMRLVFKNAIAYNVRRDNPVHIAARELADMFEDRYRTMVSQLGANAYTSELEAPALTRQPSSTGGRKSSGGKGGRGRASQGAASGPRAMDVAPPPALDGSMQQMMLMHQKMLDMEQELNSLRTAVRQTEIRTSLDQQRVAAQIPLSYDEKKALIENIQRLDGDQIAAVVDIIQSAMPSTDCGGEGDEVEIPMDELDTFTLRQLQDYVHSVQQQAISIKRKRQSMSSSSSQRTPKGKKAKSSTSVAAASVVPIAAPSAIHNIALDETPGVNGDTLHEDDFLAHGRKRSNSLDLFPSNEMELDPVVNTGKDDGKNFEAWTDVSNYAPDTIHSGSTASSGGGSWGEAVAERKDQLHRETEMKAETSQTIERRTVVETERMHTMQTASEVHSEQNSESSLQVQREMERTQRAEMSQSVEFDGGQDALYQESFDL